MKQSEKTTLINHIKKDDKEFLKQIKDVKGQIKDDVKLKKQVQQFGEIKMKKMSKEDKHEKKEMIRDDMKEMKKEVKKSHGKEEKKEMPKMKKR